MTAEPVGAAAGSAPPQTSPVADPAIPSEIDVSDHADAGPTGAPDTGPGPLIDHENTAAVSWALFTGIAFLMLGNGLQGSLLGIRSELEGFSATATGGVMAAYFIGFMAGSRAATRALATVGHIRVFAALASMASSATLVHILTITPVTWGLMRFTTGLCMAGLYVVAESWINDLATNATRGRLLAVYMVVTMGAMAGGQFLLNLADPGGFELFVIASVLVSLSLVPVSLSGRSAPPSRTPEPMSFSELLAVVPTGITVSALVGTAAGALIGMGAVYATRVGLTPGEIALFMGAPMAGGVALQFPIGSLSDRVSRRGVMFAVAIGATLAAGALFVAPTSGPITYGLMFLVGGFSFPLYSLGIAYTHDWIRPEQANGASGVLVMTNGVGAIIGPLATAGLIAAFGDAMFFVVLATAHGLIAVYLAYRIVSRDALPMSRQGRFLPVPARATATLTSLAARRRRRPVGPGGGGHRARRR
ncbi:MAG: MFS transporter [Actinomycetota bacterium]